MSKFEPVAIPGVTKGALSEPVSFKKASEDDKLGLQVDLIFSGQKTAGGIVQGLRALLDAMPTLNQDILLERAKFGDRENPVSTNTSQSSAAKPTAKAKTREEIVLNVLKNFNESREKKPISLEETEGIFRKQINFIFSQKAQDELGMAHAVSALLKANPGFANLDCNKIMGEEAEKHGDRAKNVAEDVGNYYTVSSKAKAAIAPEAERVKFAGLEQEEAHVMEKDPKNTSSNKGYERFDKPESKGGVSTITSTLQGVFSRAPKAAATTTKEEGVREGNSTFYKQGSSHSGSSSSLSGL